ncbi:hypothetical protein C8F01DRAFT_1081268 [Mycena amicta]|nr:hypothetical protein C8F01DRAFT_1081268 [Mycena amicta]
MPVRSQRSWSLLLAAIPEDDTHTHDSDDKLEYRLDLGSGALESRCPTPQPSFTNLRRPVPRRPVVVGSRKGKGLSREKEAERDCGICFELAVAPVRTHCCSQLVCGEHIASYLNDPRADGRCPACHAPPPSFTYASLGHPAHAPKDIPRAPPPSRAPTPPPIELPASAAPYAAYPSTPTRRYSTPRFVIENVPRGLRSIDSEVGFG